MSSRFRLMLVNSWTSLEKPDVDSVDGLSPAISIEQKTVSRSPRSTVGTVTEIYDYMRLLFSSIGLPHCHVCGAPITRQSVEQIVQSVLALPEGERVMILAPIVRGRKGEFKKELEKLAKDGFLRARVDGELLSLDEEIKLDKRRNHTIEAVVDRLLIKAGHQRAAGRVRAHGFETHRRRRAGIGCRLAKRSFTQNAWPA